jgi:YegS/Rv2252/BmrU family lipid kinase
MTAALIVNLSAGGGRAGRALAGVQERLRALGIDNHAEPTRDLKHAGALAAAAASAGETAVAFGGDGLIAAVAGALRGNGGVLGVLPGGRGNDFARALGIPLEPRAACDVLAAGVERALDLGAVGSRTFIGIASCGFDSVANRIANETRLVRGNAVYAYGALRALIGWKPRTVTGYTIAAANSKAYGGGMLLAPDASLQDGMLDVVIVAYTPKLRFLRLLPSVFKGEHVRLPIVEVVRCSSVRITASRPFTMFADGDPIAELPVTVRALPGAIRAIVPAGL